MVRNPAWTAADAALLTSSFHWRHSQAKLSYYEGRSPTYEAIGSMGGVFDPHQSIAFVRVDLSAGASYDFVGTGDSQVRLSIYDIEGYLLSFDDGDDVGRTDAYPRDSIVRFRPDASGTYVLSIAYEQAATENGRYAITGSKDILDDGKNIYLDAESALTFAYGNILRAKPTSGDADYLADLIASVFSGATSLYAAIGQLVDRADTTTSVATLSYQFFTGKIPGEGGVDYLVSATGPNPNSLGSAYYQRFNLENRYINFAVNLGRDGDGRAKFLAEYGSLSLIEATKKAYGTIFGGAPDDAVAAGLLSNGRDLYFETYGGDGADGLGTKAAMIGWLLAEAAKADVGAYARANEAFLSDLWDGAAFGVDLVGVYIHSEPA